MYKKFNCSCIGRKKCGENVKNAVVVGDPSEEQHIPPRAYPREPREDDTFFPSDVVDNLILQAMEGRVEPILADKERIRRK